jgi:Trypsin-co-occurring domain 2
MERIGLREAIHAVRSELIAATADATDQPVQFPVGSVQLEFQVGVTRDAGADGKVRFWVLELGASGRHQDQSVQTVTVNLEPPVDLEGRPVKVSRGSSSKP